MEFSGHLWLPFLDQPQSDIVFFAIIYFQIYHILVSKWKHGIGPNDIITFNEEFEFLSTWIIELVNIDESSHESAIVIFITKKLKNTKYNYDTEDENGNSFELFISGKSIYNDPNIFGVSWWGTDS